MLKYPSSWQNMRVALCHDWLTGMRGGERVLEILCGGFPKARIYTLFYKPDAIVDSITSHPVTYSFLNRIPGVTRYYRYLLPLYPFAIERIKHYDTDVMISTSHCVAKSLPVQKKTFHICYCFTPMRYVWVFPDSYFGRRSLKRFLIKPVLYLLRQWDKKTASNVDHFITLSHYVKERIKTYYGRDADVVYPPVDTDFFQPDPEATRENVDLIVSALVPYKRIDLAVEAYNRSGHPLKIIGGGTEYDDLKKKAGKNISFLGRVSDDEIRQHYQRCRFLIFPGEEDFGLVPVEAMACGMPVIAYNKGGVTETVQHEKTGYFFEQPTATSLLQAVDHASKRIWNTETIRLRAEKFSIQNFIDALDNSITKATQ